MYGIEFLKPKVQPVESILHELLYLRLQQLLPINDFNLDFAVNKT